MGLLVGLLLIPRGGIELPLGASLFLADPALALHLFSLAFGY